MTTQKIKKIAVLGAGVMGAQIAGHCINNKVSVILFDLPSYPKDGQAVDKNAIVNRAIANLQKLKPSPMALSIEASLVVGANYEDDLELLKDCDLVIEAIAERLDWKHDLYQKVSPYLAPHAIFATNTSGLSITKLSEGFSPDLQKRFCGIHFFNPPRYMHLLELIPTVHTDTNMLDVLESFMTSVMGKGVVRAKDTPNFLANRVGVFATIAVGTEMQKYGLTFDEVDLLTGQKICRAKSATFRTSDIVGLDTSLNVLSTMKDTLADDPFVSLFTVPELLKGLVEKGFLGQKSGAGYYKKVGKDILVLNPQTMEYVPQSGELVPMVERILKKPISERFALLRECDEPQAQFLWAIYRDVFQYIAVHAGSIARSVADIDLAVRWGYAWNAGPFEDWQEAGWLEVANWVKEDIDSGKALCNVPLPEWVFSSSVLENGGVYSETGAWSVTEAKFLPRSNLEVYKKQLFKAALKGDRSANSRTSGKTILETDAIRLWTHEYRPDILIASFKTKMNTMGPGVIDGLFEAVDIAENSYEGLVIWQPTSLQLGAPGGPFSAGADLTATMPLFMQGGAKAIEPFVKRFQDCMMRIKYSQVPVVTAISGIALGGGCEINMHAAKRVVALESFLGLVEVGVGILPAGGGLKEAAIRTAEAVALSGSSNYLEAIKLPFENAAMAKVSSSAHEAVQMGYLKRTDLIVSNVHELLYHALIQSQALADGGYRPPFKQLIPVAGRAVIATVTGQLLNMKDGGFISDHDFLIAKKIITCISGGDVDTGTLVSEEWLLKLERMAFVELLDSPKTQERMMSFLETGKPVRN